MVGIVGDLAFLHDVSALVGPAGAGAPGPCTLVVLDNAGGGIFNFLPQAAAVEAADFERLFATPQRPDVARVASGFGLATSEVATVDEFDRAVGASVGRHELAVIVARLPDRRANVALHDRTHAEVARVAEATLATWSA